MRLQEGDRVVLIADPTLTGVVTALVRKVGLLHDPAIGARVTWSDGQTSFERYPIVGIKKIPKEN